MAATVLGKKTPVPLFVLTGTMIAGVLAFADARIAVGMVGLPCYQAVGGVAANPGSLDVTITAGVCTVTSSNNADVNNILVMIFSN